jgi:hypothetical protein
MVAGVVKSKQAVVQKYLDNRPQNSFGLARHGRSWNVILRIAMVLELEKGVTNIIL